MKLMLTALALFASSLLHAQTTVFVDSAGTYAGNAPCFTTISADISRSSAIK